MTNSKLTIGLVIAILIAVIALFTPVASKVTPKLGQILDTFTGDYFNATTAFQLNGVNVLTSTSGTGFVSGSCNLIGTDVSQAASSTAAYDCAISGVTSSHKAVAQLKRATAFGTNIGWTIHASQASTTAGYVTVILGNWSGTAAVPSVTAVGSSTAVWAFK